ncbi:MAG TPA: precorrin-3B synthase [Xanthobacteraceae bacterium]|nr:precorrin-3B synthase [Xanthobacteraceae bacterium]
MTAQAGHVRQRRGACPGLSAPMPTGDGLLVRLMPIGTISLAAFATLCAAARQHGNGVIEVTARGSIQVRGLNAASAPHFAAAVAALGIAAGDGIPVHNNPLSGLDPEESLDAGALAADLRSALARTSLAARLAAKISIAIDGGGSPSLDELAADVRLCAVAINDGPALRVGIAGDAAGATQFGLVTPGNGVKATMRLLEVIAQRGRDARARDILAVEGAAPFRSAVEDILVADAPRCAPPQRGDSIGRHALRDGSLAYGLGLAFGHSDAATLERLAEAAARAGAIGLRAAPGRVLMVVGLGQALFSSFVAAAERLGFIVRAGDPRRHVVACAGAPSCTSAHMAARAIAPAIAQASAPHLSRSFVVHISGCVKGCAHPASAALTIVGTPTGCALVANGSTRDIPYALVATDQLPAVIAHFVSEREVSHV